MKKQSLRSRTADKMTCQECKAHMLIVDGFRVCENGCGKLLPADRDLANAWPDRVVATRRLNDIG